MTIGVADENVLRRQVAVDDSLILQELQRRCQIDGARERTLPVNCVAALRDGRIVSGSEDKTVKLWNPLIPLDEPGAVLSMNQHQRWVTSVCVIPSQFSLPGSATVQDIPLVCSGDGEGMVNVWNVTTGQVRSFKHHTSAIDVLLPLPNGRLLVRLHDLFAALVDAQCLPDELIPPQWRQWAQMESSAPWMTPMSNEPALREVLRSVHELAEAEGGSITPTTLFAAALARSQPRPVYVSASPAPVRSQPPLSVPRQSPRDVIETWFRKWIAAQRAGVS